jgi:hypothetical protein
VNEGEGLQKLKTMALVGGAANYDILEAAEDLQELKTMILVGARCPPTHFHNYQLSN